MKTLLGSLRRWAFGLAAEETTYTRRGFRGATEEMRIRLEEIGATFLHGYHAALEAGKADGLESSLNSVGLELRGFAFEGAAMALALLDTLTPVRTCRVANFLRGSGDSHAYMVHVGAGWVWARLPALAGRTQRQLDPLLSWLAFDGWGFHEGFFHWPDYVAGRLPPKRLDAFQRRVFDQGLGRSFWFVNGGNPAWISQTLAGFDEQRRRDLWSGLGLAATYAGRVSEAVLSELRESAGSLCHHLAQGSAFAAKARQRAGNLTEYTELATRTLCGISAAEAAQLCDITLANLPASNPKPRYAIWRERLQEHFQNSWRLRAA